MRSGSGEETEPMEEDIHYIPSTTVEVRPKKGKEVLKRPGHAMSRHSSQHSSRPASPQRRQRRLIRQMEAVMDSIQPRTHWAQIEPQNVGTEVESLSNDDQKAWAAIQALHKEMETSEDFQEERLQEFRKEIESL